jgi:ubiquinone/menaquinone biosynthesis C-methylase UbiE
MATRKDTIFERFLAPMFGNLLIDREAILRDRRQIDWEAESDRLRNPQLTYPDYYLSQNFHGVEGGYLNIDAALTYDPVTQYVLPPNETWVRQGVIDRVRCRPRYILDLGCGTGSTTVLLKQAFPQADVVGLDLSPYMLVMAQRKARQAKLEIQLRHGLAEATGFPDASFDMVTASLLFHETPVEVAIAILREAHRLLRLGGEVIILDGNQNTLRHTAWLTEIFEEPYIKAYARGSVDAWMGTAGFGDVRTEDWWWIHQVSRGVKPLSGQSAVRVEFATPETAGVPQWA